MIDGYMDYIMYWWLMDYYGLLLTLSAHILGCTSTIDHAVIASYISMIHLAAMASIMTVTSYQDTPCCCCYQRHCWLYRLYHVLSHYPLIFLINCAEPSLASCKLSPVVDLAGSYTTVVTACCGWLLLLLVAGGPTSRWCW